MTNWLDIYGRKLRERAEILKGCESSPEYREACRELCKRDKLFFINNFCWTFDPRPDKKPNHFPFITYDIQDRYIKWRDERYEAIEDGLVEKSRDMGATWLFLAWDLHRWIFDDSFQALLGSRVEDLVDKLDSSDSLFWKLEYLLKNLPNFLLPEGFDFSKHRKSMLLVNPINGNAIKGESSNASFGRQGRYSVIDLDEFAFWDNAYAAWTSCSESARCRFPVSTVHGKGNKFADLRFDSSIKMFVMDWKDHPLKDIEWYEKQKARMTLREFAQEIDRDYQASGGEIWLPKYALHKPEIEIKDPIIPVPDTWFLYGSIDHHSKNPSSCHIYGIDMEGCHYAIDERYEAESTIDDVAKWFIRHPLYKRLKYITADPSIWTKDQNVRQGLNSYLTSRAELLIEGGIGSSLLVPGIKGEDLLARDITNKLIETNKLKISPLCKALKWEFGEALHWAQQSETVSMVKNVKEVLENKNNHAWDDWKYYLTKRPEQPKPATIPMRENTLEWHEKMEEMQKKNKHNVQFV